MNIRLRERLIGTAKIAAAAVIAVSFILVVDHGPAHADPKPGIWQEAATQADGVTVRVIRDTTSGNFNVCYVASRVSPRGLNGSAETMAVAISCVPEKRP